MFVRPMRTATVWSGPPVKREVEQDILEKLLDEPGARIICGDTTAEIAARWLRAKLEMEPRPEDGWLKCHRRLSCMGGRTSKEWT